VAFEAFRNQGETRAPSLRRQVTIALSIAVHAAAIAAGVGYSFWHVEELTPPTLRVTFMSAAPPPPPPPPPAGGGGRARPKPQIKPKAVVQPKVAEIVQPREIKKEEPKEEPKPAKDEADKGGVKGGVAGGVAGGTLGGTPGGTVGGQPNGVVGGTAAAPAAKFLPPNLGMALKQSGAEPPFPATLRREGAIYRVLAKICVSASGTVDRVTIMKGADPLLDSGVVSTVKGWRFSPNTANGMPIPFCTTNMFEFKSI
jgi:protein TonB